MNAIKVTALVIIVFIFLIVIIAVNVRKTTVSQFSILLRILTNYLHIITMTMSMTTKHPPSLVSILLPLNRVGDPSVNLLSFDCFISDYVIKGPFDSNAFLKLFLMLLLPIVLFCIVALIWGLIIMIHTDWVKDIKRNLVISFISILFIFHPKLTESSINAFR